MGSNNQETGMGMGDTLLVCLLVGSLIAVSYYYYHQVVLDAKRIAMKAELQSIRTAINAYRALHYNRRPESLKALLAEKYTIPKDEKDSMDPVYLKQGKMIERHYLEVYALDKEGFPIDPFGNRYRYDVKTGDVISGTAGYESW